MVIDCADKKELRQIENAAFSKQIPAHIISNQVRRGIGSAIRDGIKYAMKNNYDIAIILAGNGKDQANEINRLVTPLVNEGYDYIQGSRFLPGGRHVRTPFFRKMFSRLFPFLWTLMTKKKCTDVTNGFRAFKLSLFSNPQIDISQHWLDHYELEYYIHYKALTLGYKVKEVPVSKIYPFSHKGGYSNISPFRDWWQIVGPLLYLKMSIRK